MSSLQTVGPDGTASTSTQTRLRQDQLILPKYSPANLTAALDTRVSALARKDYVDARDLGRPSKTYVDQQDALLLPKTQIGAANGVASIGSDGQIPADQLLRAPVRTMRGPYSIVFRTPETAYYDSTGQWDKWIGTITIPAPGSGFGVWRPMIFGQIECYHETGFGRAEIQVRYGTSSTMLARGVTANGVSDTDTFPQQAAVIPYKLEDNSTPAGWNENTEIECRVFLRATFIDTRVAIAGAHWLVGFAQRC